MSDLHARVGGVPPDWKVCRFGEALTASRSPVVVSKSDKYREIGIRSHGKGIFHKEPISGAELGDKRVFWVEPDRLVFNIVFAWERAVAVTSAAEQGMIASHRFPMFRPADNGAVDVEFLRRFFLTDRGAQLLADASPGGAGRNRTLNQKFLAHTPVTLPPLPEQRKIAAVLSSVDEVIEKTEAVIEQLQVVKKAMMQELLTRGLPGRHTRFKQTEIGEVPEEWEVEALGALLREPLRNGYSPVCPSHPTGKWILHLGAVGFGGFNATAVKPAPADDPKVDASLLRDGDLLVSRSNTRERVGLAGIYRGIPAPCSYPDLLIRIRPGERLLADFAEASLLSERGRAYFEKSARGTSDSMVKVNGAIVAAFPVALPSLGEQREICAAVQTIKTRIDSEAEVLASIRHTKAALMSVLLTGELRVTPDEDAA